MVKKPTVMIVDDNKTMRTILKEIFSTSNYEVAAVAENGRIAVENYDKLKPDIITMDILMPEMNGLEAIRNIKFIDDSAKIVVISSLSEKTEMKKCLLAGAKYYLIKPFEAEELINICSGIIDGTVDIQNII